MPAATTKTDLLAITDTEFGKLMRTITPVSDAQATAQDEDGWSIQDILAHRAHWVHLTLGWVDVGLQGGTLDIPAPGFKWSDLKRYCQELRARQAGQSWAEVKDTLSTAHTTLMARIDGLSRETLYAAAMPGGNGKWTTGRYLEAAGASHYRSANKGIRKILRTAQIAV